MKYFLINIYLCLLILFLGCSTPSPKDLTQNIEIKQKIQTVHLFGTQWHPLSRKTKREMKKIKMKFTFVDIDKDNKNYSEFIEIQTNGKIPIILINKKTNPKMFTVERYNLQLLLTKIKNNQN